MKIIKFISILLLTLSCHLVYAQSTDAVLIHIDGEPIFVSDFEYAYKKADRNQSADKENIDEFLQSFIDSKLKVAEAKRLGLDQEQAFKAEYGKYLNEAEKPYLTDTISAATVARKIYDRLGENIRASQLFIALPKENLLPKDTLEAYQKITEIRKLAVNADSEAFKNLVLEFSEDSISRNAPIPGYTGWKTSLMLPPAVEDALYATAIDSVSQPIRTNDGYYLMKVFEKREDLGQISLAHIFSPYPYENSDAAQKDSVTDAVLKIYNELLSGLSFTDAVAAYSTDLQSAARGGSLGWFGINRPLPVAFEEILFNMNAGEVSSPIEMDYGFHIFKVLDKVKQLPWEKMEKELVKSISQSERNEIIKKFQIKRLADEFPYQVNQPVYNEMLSIANIYPVTDSLYFEKTAHLENQVLVSVWNSTYTVVDFIDFLTENPDSEWSLSTDMLTHKIDDFILEKQQEKQKAALADRYSEFRHLTQEYHDGILLFDVMNQEVWEKAQNDTKGLQEFFDKDPLRYKWQSPKYKGYVIHATDKATIGKVKELIKEHKGSPDLARILSDSLNTGPQNSIYIQKGVWAKGENGFVDRTFFNIKDNREIVYYPEFILEGKLIDAPEVLNDTEGEVTAAYQDTIEKEWLNSLRKKYKVEIDQEVLQSIK